MINNLIYGTKKVPIYSTRRLTNLAPTMILATTGAESDKTRMERK